MGLILVTGATGQLGHDVVDCLCKDNYDYVAPNRIQMDIASSESIRNYLNMVVPTTIIHCAAWTQVDLAETHVDECRAVNVTGTKTIAEWCGEHDVPMLYISTDYVFPGTGSKPWDVDDETEPIGQYGLSKRDGELFVKKLKKYYIVRISWVYGSNGNNFVKTMINLSKTRDEVRVVNDQIGSPTYTKDLAPILIELIKSDKYGIYHACNEGYCSWYEFACEIFRLTNTKTKCIPITSEQYPTLAKRPKNSRLITAKLSENGFHQMPSWKVSLTEFIRSLEDKESS